MATAALIGALVISSIRQRRCAVGTAELRRLEARKSRLLEMRLNGEVDPAEFRQIKNSLETELATCRATTKKGPTVDAFDVEAGLRAARTFLCTLADHWQRLDDVNQKRQLQLLMLPNGIAYDVRIWSFGTAHWSRLFSLFATSDRSSSQMVAGDGECEKFNIRELSLRNFGFCKELVRCNSIITNPFLKEYF